MSRKKFIINTFFATLCVLFMHRGYAEPQNLSILTSEIIAWHDSGSYEQELATQIEEARKHLRTSVSNNSNAKTPVKLAVVLDIDETSITNWHYMVKRKFVYNREEVKKEVASADAPAIKPTLELFREAHERGVAIFFVSGRPESEREVTSKNLHFAGFNDWEGMYLKPEEYHDSSIVPFKANARRDIVNHGYKIIATIGDQYSDLDGGYAEKGFKLPNPCYYLP